MSRSLREPTTRRRSAKACQRWPTRGRPLRAVARLDDFWRMPQFPRTLYTKACRGLAGSAAIYRHFPRFGLFLPPSLFHTFPPAGNAPRLPAHTSTASRPLSGTIPQAIILRLQATHGRIRSSRPTCSTCWRSNVASASWTPPAAPSRLDQALNIPVQEKQRALRLVL